jgi:hypothetical protein
VLWETVLACTGEEAVAERDAALRIAGQLLEHMDLLSTAAAQGYLDELQSSGATVRWCAATCWTRCSRGRAPRSGFAVSPVHFICASVRAMSW